MPKVKLISKPDYGAAVKNIRTAMAQNDINSIKELSDKVGWEYGYTYYRIKKVPSCISLENLAQLSKLLKVPIESLVAGVIQE